MTFVAFVVEVLNGKVFLLSFSCCRGKRRARKAPANCRNIRLFLIENLLTCVTQVLLYLTMRFSISILKIQGLQAYHAGDKLNVEVDIVLDEKISLRDSHDLGESLQYVLESVPTVDRAFVHQDYAGWNLPTHMQQQGV